MAYFSLFILSTLFAGILMPFSALAAADNTNGSVEAKTSLVAIARPRTGIKKSIRRSDREAMTKIHQEQARASRIKALPPQAHDLDELKTFHDVKKGISFEYSENWKISRIPSVATPSRLIPTITPFTSYQNGDASIGHTHVTLMKEFSTTELRDLAMKQFVSDVEAVGLGKAGAKTIGAFRGFVSTFGKENGEQGMMFFFTKKDILYAFVYRAESKEVFDQFMPIFDHVLSTLKVKAKPVGRTRGLAR